MIFLEEGFENKNFMFVFKKIRNHVEKTKLENYLKSSIMTFVSHLISR